LTSSFSVLNPKTVYVLRINNGGLNGEFAKSTGVITLNGVRILGPRAFNPRIRVLDWPVRLLANNQLRVELQGTAGSGISLQIISLDFGPPSISGTISPAPNAAGWNNTNVTVSFTCFDKTSGVASCPSPVLLTNEGAHQVVSGTVTDKAGNKATTSVTVSLDKTPPVISGTIAPPPDAAGWNSSGATVSFGCSDPLSGIASCSTAVALTTEGADQIVTGTAIDLAGNIGTVRTPVNISTSFFVLRNYAGKCLDYGQNTRAGGTGVFLNDCAVAHPIRVQEINDRHAVILHAGSQVIGVGQDTGGTIGGPAPPAQSEYALELQTYEPLLASTTNQIFRLDGDSIILEGRAPCLSTHTNFCPPPPPQFVVQVQNARGANGSPLVAGPRNLANSEFWDFNAIDGSAKDPTKGFVRVSTNYQLWNAVCSKPKASSSTFNLLPLISDPGQPDDGSLLTAVCSDFGETWGKVVVISDDPNSPLCNALKLGPCIDLSNFPPLVLPAGVTLRGDRRGTNFGPQLFSYNQQEKFLQDICGWCMIDIKGDYTRIAGLRVHGPSRSSADNQPSAEGILVHFSPASSFASTTQFIALIDHNDISDWQGAGVNVVGGQTGPETCDGIDQNPATLANVRIERNFVHHNERQNLGYGTQVAAGGRALVSANTFDLNRHAIAGDAEVHDSYRASFNLVLSQAPLQYGLFGIPYQTHDFDMHGTGDGGFGGWGGYNVDIVANTFLGPDRHNFEWRGQPCIAHNFHSNISLQAKDDALNYKTSSVQVFGKIDFINVADNPNQFQLPDPTGHFGVGDFDADGADDLFLATGSAWYSSAAGAREWRFLSAKTDTIDQLLFGDFDGDGRTDAVAIHGGQFVVSWGGISDWEVLNSDPISGRAPFLPGDVSAMATGDFNGDRIADIFYADGQLWWVSYGGNTPFVPVNTSSFAVRDLRFGDFDGDGAADVFGVVSNGQFNTWSYSKSATGSWADGYLRPALLNTVDGLFVADFNGDGVADVAGVCDANSDGCWRTSYGGLQDWYYVNLGTFRPDVAGVGHFLGHTEADLLSWNDRDLWISTGAISPLTRHSSQDMH